MPKSAPRARNRRPLPKQPRRTTVESVARRTRNVPAKEPADRIARVLQSPLLARVVPQLPPETLHALISHRGLDAAGELIAAATPSQLTAVFDIDLWRRSGRDDRFDDHRFGEWLEALVESDELLAARIIAAIDEELAINGLSRYVRVFDPAAVSMSTGDDETMPSDGRSFDGLSREVGGYLVRAKRTDAWDAIIALLFALAEHHPHSFHVVMCGCRRLSNSTPEIDGLDDLLTEPEQALHDVAAERDDRRSQQGYLTTADARAFLQMARQRHRHPGVQASSNPIAEAYFRAVDDGAHAVEHGPGRPTASDASETGDRESVAAVAALLEDAGLLAARPRALLTASSTDSAPPTRLDALLRQIADSDEIAFAERSRELAFLANVLMAGGSVLSRAFTPREASDAALAICNLGLEHSPAREAFDVNADLVAAFEIGWTVLHELSMLVARRLIDALTALQSVDNDIQDGLFSLRRDLVRYRENTTPWLARGSLDVIAMIDMPACVSLQALLDECPVLPEAMTAILERRTGAIDPMAFEFISTGHQVEKVRDFAAALLFVLMR